MSIISRQVGSAPDGISLQTRVDDMEIQCYVVVGEPDLELVTGIVPPEDFESGADVHAAAVTSAAQAGEQVEEVLENVSPGDIAVFLCANPGAYQAALDALGVDAAPGARELN
jgi:hypothetical protein